MESAPKEKAFMCGWQPLHRCPSVNRLCYAMGGPGIPAAYVGLAECLLSNDVTSDSPGQLPPELSAEMEMPICRTARPETPQNWSCSSITAQTTRIIYLRST